MPRRRPCPKPRPAAVCGVLLAALGVGCGVAGRPLPPGPTPPAAPLLAAPISTPEGLALSLAEPLRDLDGARVPSDDPSVELWVYASASAEGCAGPPLVRGPSSGVLVPADRSGSTLRLVAVRAGRIGEPSAPLAVTWTAPPPPPEVPLAFADGSGRVQLSWLPPDAPITEIEIRRGGRPVARAPADQALWSERPEPGRHRYTLVGLAPGLRTGPSAPAEVELRPVGR